jgi:Arc/MetJ-type ribon-helix-helix transcriptional regulator
MKRRSKMLSVRLSAEQYASLQELCTTNGTGSLSDLARLALTKLLRDRVARDAVNLDMRLEQVLIQIKNLDQKIEDISARLPAE